MNYKNIITMGFALGYWFGMQKRTNIERNG
jgi:hypothetical protein